VKSDYKGLIVLLWFPLAVTSCVIGARYMAGVFMFSLLFALVLAVVAPLTHILLARKLERDGFAGSLALIVGPGIALLFAYGALGWLLLTSGAFDFT
jgi:hypothetical protein